jgi:hypothetical protein
MQLWSRASGDFGSEVRSDPLELARLTSAATSSDPDRLAHELGATVSLRAMPPTLWGATLGQREIVLNENTPPSRRRFALVHELAHVMVRVGLADIEWQGDEEYFADRFACAFLAAKSFDTAKAATSTEPWVYWWDRASKSRPLAIEIIDDLVLCGICGPRRRSWPCACSRLRTQLRSPKRAA